MCFCGLTCFHWVYFEQLSMSELRSLLRSSVRGFLPVHGVVYLPSQFLVKGHLGCSSVWLALTMLPEPLCIHPPREASERNTWVPF